MVILQVLYFLFEGFTGNVKKHCADTYSELTKKQQTSIQRISSLEKQTQNLLNKLQQL